jgi:hypothetical protein
MKSNDSATVKTVQRLDISGSVTSFSKSLEFSDLALIKFTILTDLFKTSFNSSGINLVAKDSR